LEALAVQVPPAQWFPALQSPSPVHGALQALAPEQ